MFFGTVGGQLTSICRGSWTYWKMRRSSRRSPWARWERANTCPSYWPRAHIRPSTVPTPAPWRKFGAAPRRADSAARTRPERPTCRRRMTRCAEAPRGGPRLGSTQGGSSTPSQRRSVLGPAGWPQAACGCQRRSAAVNGGQRWPAVVSDGSRFPAAATRVISRPL